MSKGIYSIVILILLTTCVKPYDFEPENFEKVLVVDGSIHDTPGPHSVRLSYTYPLDTFVLESVSGATVYVEDGSGNVIPFTWNESGEYLSPNDFQGVIGESYRLHVELDNGEGYESTFQPLIKAPPIDSIYGRFAELPRPEGDRNAGGIQFFIDTHDDTGMAKYFRYQWEEAYKIQVPYPASHFLDDDGNLAELQENIGTCFLEDNSKELIFGTTVLSTANRLVEQPIRYVSEEEQMLRQRYTILVKQYAVNEAAYLFYKRLFDANESGGTLFDKQLGSVYGNMVSVQDPSTSALGFFEVSGVTELRRFYDRGEFDERLDNNDFAYNCSYSEIIDTVATMASFYLKEGSNYNVFSFYSDPEGGPDRISLHIKNCTQCTHYASNIPPEYWID